ncbi:hypothetical protein NJT12_10405 [Flavobacterium sp. AC]|uniref:Uncharacterized protein n=1 Tax=Flavobacterium azizsancarii TaxID=2961580 RepID=A0ABT4WBT5_9FLAO|nr:hypothetical protein [Flavobacterium azizsancarii]MDA6070028.1 hypothetical protein [Flavobacterium azizsancarii]
MAETYLTSIKKKEYWTYYVLGILAFLSLAIFCFTKYTPENHSRNICLILSIVFIIISLICSYNLISIKSFCIANNNLTVTLYGKVIKNYNLNDVESCTQKQHKGRYEKWETLTLYIKTGEKIKISSSIYDNYFELKNELTRNKVRNFKIEELTEQKFGLKVALFLLLIGFLFLFGAYNSSQVKDINVQDIIVFGDKTSEHIQYIKNKNSYIKINVENYPNLNFIINGNEINATSRNDLMDKIKVGDSIFIGINKSEYKRKLIKVDSLSFADKYFFNENINIVSLKSSKKDYLKLSDVNTIQSDRKYWNFVIFGFFGLIMILAGIFGIQKSIENQDL